MNTSHVHKINYRLKNRLAWSWTNLRTKFVKKPNFHHENKKNYDRVISFFFFSILLTQKSFCFKIHYFDVF